EGLPARAAELGEWLGSRLRELAAPRPHVGEVRGIGLLWALELVAPGTRAPLDAGAVARVGAGLKRRHVHLHRRDNLVYVAPPLVATKEELSEALELLGEALDEGFPAGSRSAAPSASAARKDTAGAR
ncbi:MAG TPA: aminotransferase class III-fold pyridoxal phosphate-dependent enzyme, partial [Polyangia bacterium]